MRADVRLPFSTWSRSDYRSSCCKVGVKPCACSLRPRRVRGSRQCALKAWAGRRSRIVSTWMVSTHLVERGAGTRRRRDAMRIQSSGPDTCATIAVNAAPDSAMPRPGSPTARGYGADWQRVRLVILERDDHRCHWCHGLATTVDHVRPLSAGGARLDATNLVAACVSCNSRRGARAADRIRPRLAPGSGWLR